MLNNIRKNFDNEAINWDTDNAKVLMAKAISGPMINSNRININQDVLDFGCGTGLVTLEILPFVKSIVGVDSSTGMLERLHEKIVHNNLSNITCQFVNFEQGVPIQGHFDLIISSMTAHHIPSTLDLFKEWFSALRKNGQLCFADLVTEDGSFHSDNTGVFHHGFNIKDLENKLEEVGFVDIQSSIATTIKKEVNGGLRQYPIFLLCAKKE